MKKRLIFGMMVALTAIAPIAASCNFGSNQTGTYAKTDIANIKPEVTKKDAEVKAAIEAGNTKKMDIALLTAGGRVNDLSFNQSVWEAISQHSLQTDNTTSQYIEPQDDSAVPKQYDVLVAGNKNVWILTGFQHSYLFAQWLSIESNLNAVANKDVVIIGVDWVLSGLTDAQQQKLKGKIITLNYKTEEAGWIAGYASGDYLAKKFPDDRNKRGIATFGGHSGKGVTDFITGFLSGIEKFNSEAGNVNKKAKITSTPIVTDTNFSTADTAKVETVKSITRTGNPAIILPVAGPFTTIVAQEIASSGKSQSIIGVDTDQSKAFPSQQSVFFTSIEKRIGTTIYRVLTDLFTKKANSDIISDFNTNPKIQNIRLGYWDEFVSLSNSTKAGDDKSLADGAIAEAIKKFKEIVPESKKAEATSLLGIKEMVDVNTNGKTVKAYNEEILNGIIAEINK
ncbi:BMP family ABC transporter substrate-binding protein [Mycoplasma phocoeninasale]|uniref:BMP family ABC transporter substrate-binding protein n=1 Tax=Mycoplasma phocoeninasale TaxID=2726117 RepID=UPI00196750A4|nr:BMP family ABC transporter substrate-binding protein [Mycoplasma phocoeninasale]MBN0970905.1 BMP family protein [Mycoplasma phocoeninasale]